MPIVKLSQSFIDHEMKCPEGKSRVEYCDIDHPGLYVLASAASNIASYYLRYKNGNGKTCHQKIGRTTLPLADAIKRFKELKAEITLGADPRGAEKARKEVITFAAFFENNYIPYVKPRKRSWERDNELYRLRIKKVFGDRRLNQITRQQIQSFHTELLKEGLAPATCDHHIKLIKHALFLAIDWGLLTEKNPAARIPLFNRDNKVEHYLDDAQLENLLAVLRTDDNRAICQITLFMLSTGCRLNEALSATWSQIDKSNRVWRIPALNSKSKRVRSVPLNDSALDVLEQLDTEGKFDSVFLNVKTEQAYTTIHKVWHRLRGKAGLPHLRLHDLRHQYASFLVNSGRTLYEVQQILGHSNPIVTQRYAHLSSKSLQAAANSASLLIKAASVIPATERPAKVPA